MVICNECDAHMRRGAERSVQQHRPGMRTRLWMSGTYGEHNILVLAKKKKNKKNNMNTKTGKMKRNAKQASRGPRSVATPKKVLEFIKLICDPKGRKKVSEVFQKFEMEGFMTQKGLWNIARENVLQDRGAVLPRASFQCFIALDPPNLCNILAPSLSASPSSLTLKALKMFLPSHVDVSVLQSH